MTGRVGAIVLAGGRSTRFGRDKLAEPLDGRPLLEHAIEAVRSVADEIVVVAAPEAPEATGATSPSAPGAPDPSTSPATPPGVRVVRDPEPFAGPLAGLATGLDALDDDIDRVIVVAGDMPGLVPAVLTRLLDALDGPAEPATAATDTAPRAVVLRHGADTPPLPLAIDPHRARTAARAALERGDRRLRDLVTALDATTIPEPTWRADDPDAATLRDIDVPDDLAPRA